MKMNVSQNPFFVSVRSSDSRELVNFLWLSQRSISNPRSFAQRENQPTNQSINHVVKKHQPWEWRPIKHFALFARWSYHLVLYQSLFGFSYWPNEKMKSHNTINLVCTFCIGTYAFQSWLIAQDTKKVRGKNSIWQSTNTLTYLWNW